MIIPTERIKAGALSRNVIQVSFEKDIHHQLFITPCIGVINRKHYYGYPVFSIIITWLKWHICITFGMKQFIDVK